MKKAMAALCFTIATATSALAAGETHYLAIHVDQNDPRVMNMALNNAQNVKSYYEAQGDSVVIEMVAYGPGLNMYVPGKSPVADRIETMALEMQGEITFSGCGNTLRKMSEKAGTEVSLMSEAQVVPAGVVRLMELQNEGYAYLRP